MNSYKDVARIYVGIVVPAFVVFPLLTALIKYARLPRHFKVLTWYLVLSAVTSVFSTVWAFRKWNNMPVMHIYTFLECWLLVLYFRSLLREAGQRWYVKLLVPGFFLVCCANAIFVQGIYTYNTYTKSLEALILISFCIACFKAALDSAGTQSVFPRQVSYVNSAFLIYFSGSLVLFTIFNFIVAHVLLVHIMMSIHATLLMIVYLIIGVAIWKQKL